MTTSVFKSLGSATLQTSTVPPNIKKIVVVNSQPKIDVGISADDLVSELEKEFGIKDELIAARQELAANGTNGLLTISDLRLKLGLSQRELAAKANLYQPNISAIESGRRKPDYETAGRLAKALGVTTDEIYAAYAAGQKSYENT